MYIIKLMNEFLHGAIWVYDESGISTNYSLIDEDTELQELNEETKKLFDSYYEFDTHDVPCWFNDELERNTKNQMIDLTEKIKNRLNAINDNSFIVEDTITDRLRKL